MAGDLHRQYGVSPTSPRRARRDLVTYLGEQDAAALTEVATLLVSELVTNSVLHGAGPITLHGRIEDGRLRVAVDDTGANAPAAREPGIHGRGLHIVARLADAWGSTRLDGHGNTTWFELRAP